MMRSARGCVATILDRGVPGPDSLHNRIEVGQDLRIGASSFGFSSLHHAIYSTIDIVSIMILARGWSRRVIAPKAGHQSLRSLRMNPEPTIISSVDYLVELSDDGKQPDQLETEVIILPPAPHGTDGSPGTTRAPEQPS